MRREVWACDNIHNVWAKHEQCGDFVLPLTNFCKYYHVRSKQHTTPRDVELKFQMQAITKMLKEWISWWETCVRDLRRWENLVTWLEHVPKTWERLGLNRNQTMVVGWKAKVGWLCGFWGRWWYWWWWF